MKIAVMDDEPAERERLVQMIEHYLYMKHDDLYRVVSFGDAQSFLLDMQTSPAHIAFLDIYLDGEEGGIRAANRLQQIAPDCLIVFVTTSPDFAVEGFRLQAVHYCLKPVQPEMLEECFKRCKARGGWKDRSVALPVGSEVLQIPLHAICFIESRDHVASFWLQGREKPIEARISLSQIFVELDDARFLRASRSYIINMDRVESMTTDAFILQGGMDIPISRQERSALRSAYSKYIIERTRRGY